MKCLVFVPALTALLLFGTAPALAGSHLWRFSEFYSSPDRKVQFIEMREIGGSDIETGIAGHWFATNTYNRSRSSNPSSVQTTFLLLMENLLLSPSKPTTPSLSTS